MTELDSNKTLSGTYKYMNSSDMYIILLLEDVCFWTHYHRVILIKPATPDDEQTDEKPSDIEEAYLKSLKKNIIIIHRDKPEIGWR